MGTHRKCIIHLVILYIFLARNLSRSNILWNLLRNCENLPKYGNFLVFSAEFCQNRKNSKILSVLCNFREKLAFSSLLQAKIFEASSVRGSAPHDAHAVTPMTSHLPNHTCYPRPSDLKII